MSLIPDTLPGTEHWTDKLIASYAFDPWFFEQDNLKDLSLDEGIYFNEDGRVVILDSGDLHLKLIFDFHNSPYVGHVGIGKTTRLLSRCYWWPCMDQHIATYVRDVTLVRHLRIVRRNL